jgi:hypothetical protein
VIKHSSDRYEGLSGESVPHPRLLVEVGLYSTFPFGRTYAVVSSIARLDAEMVAEMARWSAASWSSSGGLAEAAEDSVKVLSQSVGRGMSG